MLVNVDLDANPHAINQQTDQIDGARIVEAQIGYATGRVLIVWQGITIVHKVVLFSWNLVCDNHGTPARLLKYGNDKDEEKCDSVNSPADQRVNQTNFLVDF